MEEQVVKEGIVDSIIYKNPENEYTVFSLNTKHEEDSENESELICVGTIADLYEGENIRITGNYVVHPSYGKQLNVQVYEKTVPKTEYGIEKYLASGVIRGIGEKLASKIVERFKTETFYIIEKKPELLSSIRGISPQKALRISAIFIEQEEMRRAIMFLQQYGITPTYAVKIFKKFRENTIKIVETNPYALADEVFGIGFKIADNIAEKVGIDKNSVYRIRAGVKFVLNQAAANGNVFLPMERLKKDSAVLLAIEEDIIENTVMELNITKQIYVEKSENNELMVFLNFYYYAESYCAKKISELSMFQSEERYGIDKRIKEIENETGTILAENQKLAVKKASQSGILVITGGPGTGKTTTINAIIAVLKDEGLEIVLAAPTGRAAKRMTDATGIDAQTIHRLLGTTYMADDSKKQKFEKNEDNPIEADVIIIDETSMVDILLMHSLLKAIPHGARLILAGDVDQLPSVGPGNVLKDIINSNIVTVVRLTEVFRQAAKSAIIMNAHRINNGEYPVLNEKGSDFFFMKRYEQEGVINTIKELVTKRLPNYMKCDMFKDIQVLTPMRKSPIGVINLNASLQECLNPKAENKAEKEFRNIVFREGDKVMQIKNNYNMVWKIYDQKNCLIDEGTGVFNGDEGIIKRINNREEYIEVLFDDLKIVKYDYSQLDEIELSYAVTIHKSQGSEYKAVVIPIHSGPYMLMSRNLIYTAVTRAKKLAVIVGIPETLYKMVDNNKEINRYTYLKERIIEFSKFLGDDN